LIERDTVGGGEWIREGGMKSEEQGRQNRNEKRALGKEGPRMRKAGKGRKKPRRRRKEE